MNINSTFVPRLAAKFMANARRAREVGTPDGTHFEQIVTAMLVNRVDWLPGACENILDALSQLVQHDETWFHTMIEVNRMNWCKTAEMSAERL